MIMLCVLFGCIEQICADQADSISVEALNSQTLNNTAMNDSEIWVQIASGDEDTVLKVVEKLVATYHPKYFQFLKAISQGEVYRSLAVHNHHGIVMTGEEKNDNEGNSVYPLYMPDSAKTLIKTHTGDTLFASLDSLQEVPAGRLVRIAVMPFIDAMDLLLGTPEKKKQAAENMANNGDSSKLSLLKKALEIETDKQISASLQVSLAKLELKYADPVGRLQAALNLSDLNNPLAIPVLESRLKTVDAGGESDPRIRIHIQESLQELKTFQTMMAGIQTIFIGLSLSSILILIALGLAVIYGLMGVINMAHGEFMMIGAYTTFLVQTLCVKIFPSQPDLFFLLALPFAFIVAGLFGMAIEWLIVRHLYKRPLESLLATWGVSLLLVQGARSIFGDLTSVSLPMYLSGGLEIAPQVVLPFNRIFIIGLTIVMMLGLFLIFYRTNFGLKLRAVTQNRAMSSCLGVSVRKVDNLAFFLGSGIAGVAGWAMTLIGNVVPNMGQTYIVDSFLVVVTGGVGKLLGVLWAGLGIGFTTKIVEPMFEAVYAKVFILILIILFLQVRPTGIFPQRGRNDQDA